MYSMKMQIHKAIWQILYINFYIHIDLENVWPNELEGHLTLKMI